MRVIVCLLVATFVVCCSTWDEQKRFLKELEDLEEVMKARKNHSNEYDVNGFRIDRSLFLTRLNTRMTAYLGSEDKRDRYTRCSTDVWFEKVPEDLDDAAKQPPKDVKEAVSQLSTDGQRIFNDYNENMLKVIRILLRCSKPKVSQKHGRQKDKVKKPHDVELYKQYEATIKLQKVIASNPPNVAWRLFMFVMSLPGDARVEVSECAKEAQSKATTRFKEDFAKELDAMSELSSSVKSPIISYISTLYRIIYVLLDCTVPPS